MPVSGILPVIPTPFQHGRFDPASFERLLEHMAPGVDGYTLLGSTGEAPSLTVEGREAVAEAALGMTPEGMRVVVGVTSTCLDDSIRLARHAHKHGAAAVLCASPFYFANGEDGLRRYFAALDSAIEIDLVLYDNPVATRTVLDKEFVVSLADSLRHLRTVKLTDHALDKVDRWHEAGLNVLGGDDPILFQYLAAGVDGVMMIAPAVFPVKFRHVWEAVQAGELEQALEQFADLLPFLHLFGIGDEIVTTKALLAELGIFSSDEALAPLMPVDEQRRMLLTAAYQLAMPAPGRPVSSI
jgi:4-hydroxy-tetrahydrodipicolinate synthase